MKLHKTIRDMVLLTIPLLLFAALFELYKWANEKYIVKWFGCACPKIDAYGNLIDSFNANDFTQLFWFIVSLCVTAFAVLLSKRIPKSHMWIRAVYVVVILLVSLFISSHFYHMLQWM